MNFTAVFTAERGNVWIFHRYSEGASRDHIIGSRGHFKFQPLWNTRLCPTDRIFLITTVFVPIVPCGCTINKLMCARQRSQSHFPPGSPSHTRNFSLITRVFPKSGAERRIFNVSFYNCRSADVAVQIVPKSLQLVLIDDMNKQRALGPTSAKFQLCSFYSSFERKSIGKICLSYHFHVYLIIENPEIIISNTYAHIHFTHPCSSSKFNVAWNVRYLQRCVFKRENDETLFFYDTAAALVVVKLEVPSIVDPRWEKVSLKCVYNLHGGELYSVKWYKDGHEFFRFMPGSTPTGRDYNVQGVFVDVKHSDNKQVTLLGQASPDRRGATSIYKRELQRVIRPRVHLSY